MRSTGHAEGGVSGGEDPCDADVASAAFACRFCFCRFLLFFVAGAEVGSAALAITMA